MIMKSCNPYEFPDLGTGLNFFRKIMRSRERIHFNLNLKQWNSKCQSHMLECLFNSETILFRVGLRKIFTPEDAKVNQNFGRIGHRQSCKSPQELYSAILARYLTIPNKG